ncbi:MAG: hypothetical protein A4E40_00143 [Methanoregulaceae archaeon PtaU1.Bin059]|nr:MAG: hypothetical protein A4E40_00143 [Methanoregulaceae archaeon PtaU1.Bin059]
MSGGMNFRLSSFMEQYAPPVTARICRITVPDGAGQPPAFHWLYVPS